MTYDISIQNEELFKKINIISNKLRFKILEVTNNNEMNVTSLSSMLKISYNKTADYVTMLEKLGLLTKIKKGKESYVVCNIKILNNSIQF